MIRNVLRGDEQMEALVVGGGSRWYRAAIDKVIVEMACCSS
jgi:hypothetical protein